MSEMIELTTTAARLNLLTDLIRERAENAEQAARHLLLYGDNLTPEQHSELTRHIKELRTSISEMKSDFGRIVNLIFNNN